MYEEGLLRLNPNSPKGVKLIKNAYAQSTISVAASPLNDTGVTDTVSDN